MNKKMILRMYEKDWRNIRKVQDIIQQKTGDRIKRSQAVRFALSFTTQFGLFLNPGDFNLKEDKSVNER